MKLCRLLVRGTTVALALGVVAMVVSSTQAADISAGKGGWQLIKASRLKTLEQVQAVNEGNLIIMSCPKCKNVELTVVQKQPKGNITREQALIEHVCPGCRTSFEITGHGKAKKRELIHECTECSDSGALCCVVR